MDDRDFYGDEPDRLAPDLLLRLAPVGRTFGSGLFGYVLRPRGAQALLDAAETEPIMQAVDWWVWERLAVGEPHDLTRLVGLKASPALAASPEGTGRDSDNDETYAPLRSASCDPPTNLVTHPPSFSNQHLIKFPSFNSELTTDLSANL